MKKLLCLILLLTVAFPITIQKRVYGPSLLDVNDTLEVEINITSSEPVKLSLIHI